MPRKERRPVLWAGSYLQLKAHLVSRAHFSVHRAMPGVHRSAWVIEADTKMNTSFQLLLQPVSCSIPIHPLSWVPRPPRPLLSPPWIHALPARCSALLLSPAHGAGSCPAVMDLMGGDRSPLPSRPCPKPCSPWHPVGPTLCWLTKAR